MNVSIVVPAFDAEDTLAETLTSVLQQTHGGWEVVVVDDGSRDATAAIARGFAERDARIRLLRQANAGEAGARNAGIAETRYDWLLFLDADDWIAPEYLARMTGALSADGKLDAVHCGYARVAADGSLIVEPYQPPVGDMFATWARRSAFPVHACIVRKALVHAVGGFDVSFRKSADWDLWQRIARTGARFGAVREVLAFYRMRPGAASLGAREMLENGLRVLRQGHAPDPRVRDPHPEHAEGAPPGEIASQEFYLLSWCAGLLLGSGGDARSLLALLEGERFPEIYPPAVAQCLFEAAALPRCLPPSSWETLWPELRGGIENFLTALEQHTGAPALAERTRSELSRMALVHAPSWAAVMREMNAASTALEEQKTQLERVASERARSMEKLQANTWALEQTNSEQRLRLEEQSAEWERVATETARCVADLRTNMALLEQTSTEQHRRIEELGESHAVAEEEGQRWERIASERQAAIDELTVLSVTLQKAGLEGEQRASVLEGERNALRESIQRSVSERNTLFQSPERRLGDLVLNRIGLGRPFWAAHSVATVIGQRLVVARLAVERRFFRPGKRRMMTTICWNFPIHSQTFVYQELTQLERKGMALRLIYSKLDPHDQLPSSFGQLWDGKRRLFLNRRIHERDFAHYRRRMPEKVAAMVAKICQASGIPEQDLLSHDNFLEAFSFTRMVEAYRPDYLHSYFFYDRSLMALVAGYLLQIPRGISCYADHVLKDYELKLVGLHMELCDVVVATSDRIKRELLEIAQGADPARILVKPNGINTESFAVLPRSEPEPGAPFRIVTVCRIEPKKGLLELVEAVHLLRERGLRIEAHVVGAPDDWSAASMEYKRQLDIRITERNLWGTVHLEGRQGYEGVLRILGFSHLFVAPFVETDTGDKDGIPTALLEGMATGLASVATDAGSICEVIENGREGLLVPQRNPAALADAIEALLIDPERRARLGQEAASTVRNRFDVRTCETAFHERVWAASSSRNGGSQ